MLKKIFILVFLFIGFLLSDTNLFAGNCQFDASSDTVSGVFKECIGDNKSLVTPEDLKAEAGFKDEIYRWIRNIAGMLGLFAIGFIVYGALLMVMSTGDDEKVKKGKDIVKWSILGYLGIVLASSIIAIVVNIMYGIDI